jgi:hypothetical protein
MMNLMNASKTKPAAAGRALPITPAHVANPNLNLHLYGAGRRASRRVTTRTRRSTRTMCGVGGARCQVLK